jgi:hypothetical protein
MESEEECRRRAEDCTLLARLMSSERDRHVMFAAARRWKTLAEAAAKANDQGSGEGSDGTA